MLDSLRTRRFVGKLTVTEVQHGPENCMRPDPASSFSPAQGGYRLGRAAMTIRLNEEALFWMRLAAFAHLAEWVLASGAPLADAEALLLGRDLPGSLPSRYACLAGGRANTTAIG
ncbi:MAG: hypothetical protein KA603_05000 [Azonexus sp.]|nr:hypothetical protein [Betaproteobacteria bacterium]MBK8918497.1 hypothetical protein [Betaproteobacteria bacterium]MBP6035475.1 hypothetical protein [Azonexus sp.]MBP6906401.1 hypothetical protein [Azonexus sp.]